MNLNEILILEDQSQLVQDSVTVFVIVALSIVLGAFLKKIVLRRIAKFARESSFGLDDIATHVIRRMGWGLYIAIGFIIASRFVELSEVAEIALLAYTTLVVGFYIILVADFFTKKALLGVLSKDNEHEDDLKDDQTVIRFVSLVIKALLWSTLIIIILQNVGYNVSTLLGGLGVAGLAIAFAIQNILGDIFSFLTIYLDKPFKVGDFVVVGEDAGFIRKIGIKSTRIETLQGQELVVSNAELTSARINNYKHMQKRRIQFDFGVSYDTSNEKMRKVTDIFKAIFEHLGIAELDRVHFKAFGDSALIFEVVYFVDSPDYDVYMDVQQKINLEIKEKFENEGIEMAFPTQTLYVHKIS